MDELIMEERRKKVQALDYFEKALALDDKHFQLVLLGNELVEVTDLLSGSVQLHLSTKIGHKTKKIRHKKRIDVQDSSTFLTSFKLVRQTMPSIMQTRSADGRVTFPILLRRQVA